MSTLDDGIAGFGSYAMEVVHLAPMIVGMIALPLLYLAVRDRDPGLLWRDLQFRMMVGELALPEGALVGAIVRDGAAFIASGDTVIRPRDEVFVVCRPDAIAQLETLLA